MLKCDTTDQENVQDIAINENIYKYKNKNQKDE